MTKPIVTVAVTPTCKHPDGWLGSGDPYEGQHLIVGSQGVWVDGTQVIFRDRRMKSNREPGHPWIADGAAYTGFFVDVRTEVPDEH